ncbi:hypothetical protein DFP72DRAFT_257666 [Ephemerocybe angulata]|uniref:Uncharacterized protein n=1 Tax=Ephemerocybe angulata TaxID=980116 RepID=A0A8H6H8P7_9AGAR|nr:hypothetical protein DFP72DRAFT_257666 [Tulosesus angulatus]
MPCAPSRRSLHDNLACHPSTPDSDCFDASEYSLNPTTASCQLLRETSPCRADGLGIYGPICAVPIRTRLLGLFVTRIVFAPLAHSVSVSSWASPFRALPPRIPASPVRLRWFPTHVVVDGWWMGAGASSCAFSTAVETWSWMAWRYVVGEPI